MLSKNAKRWVHCAASLVGAAATAVVAASCASDSTGSTVSEACRACPTHVYDGTTACDDGKRTCEKAAGSGSSVCSDAWVQCVGGVYTNGAKCERDACHSETMAKEYEKQAVQAACTTDCAATLHQSSCAYQDTPCRKAALATFEECYGGCTGKPIDGECAADCSLNSEPAMLACGADTACIDQALNDEIACKSACGPGTGGGHGGAGQGGGGQGGAGGGAAACPGTRYEIVDPGSGDCAATDGTGLVRDIPSGLVWARQAFSKPDSGINWMQADEHCKSVGARLPTQEEALGIAGGSFDKCFWPCGWVTWTSTFKAPNVPYYVTGGGDTSAIQVNSQSEALCVR